MENSKHDYSRIINLEVGIPTENIEAHNRVVKLELLAEIIDNIDDDPYEYLIEKYLELKNISEVNDKSKESRNTE